MPPPTQRASFTVRPVRSTELLEIEGAWTTPDFLALLDALEYGDPSGMSDEELREICVLSLQDLKPQDAARVLLEHAMAGALRDGQIRNAAVEMLDEKLWEEYADSALHERFFNVGSLLYAAFPGVVPKPDAVSIVLKVSATTEAGRSVLAGPLDESFLVRLIASGMESRAVLHRMYGEQVRGKPFPEASSIVWIVHPGPADADPRRIEIIGSGYWLDAFEADGPYECDAQPDRRR